MLYPAFSFSMKHIPASKWTLNLSAYKVSLNADVLVKAGTITMPSFSLGMINSQLVVSPDSDIFSLWRHPPVNPEMKIYLFNLTNVEAWLNGSDAKLRVEEVGPWVYRETWMKKNITFHEYVDPMTPDPKYHEVPTNLPTILNFLSILIHLFRHLKRGIQLLTTKNHWRTIQGCSILTQLPSLLEHWWMGSESPFSLLV